MDKFESYLDGDAAAKAGLSILKSIVPDLSCDNLAKLTAPGVAEALEAFRRFQVADPDVAPRQKRPSTAGSQRSSISGPSGRRLSQNASGTQSARRSSQIAAGDGETERPQTASADIRNARNSTVARDPQSNHLKQVFNASGEPAPVKFEKNLSKRNVIETKRPSETQQLARRGSGVKEEPKEEDKSKAALEKRMSTMQIEPSIYRNLLDKELKASNKMAPAPRTLAKSNTSIGLMQSTPTFDPASSSAKPTMPAKDSKRQSVLEVHKDKLDAAAAPSKYRGLVGE
jgi:hypothetical protein